MTRLRDLAKLIRSKNAGPFELTVDVMLPDRATYERVVASGALDTAHAAAAFRTDPDKVQVFNYAPANAVKITVPRFAVSGDPADSDLFGGQQFAPIVDIDIP